MLRRETEGWGDLWGWLIGELIVDVIYIYIYCEWAEVSVVGSEIACLQGNAHQAKCIIIYKWSCAVFVLRRVRIIMEFLVRSQSLVSYADKHACRYLVYS